MSKQLYNLIYNFCLVLVYTISTISISRLRLCVLADHFFLKLTYNHTEQSRNSQVFVPWQDAFLLLLVIVEGETYACLPSAFNWLKKPYTYPHTHITQRKHTMNTPHPSHPLLPTPPPSSLFSHLTAHSSLSLSTHSTHTHKHTGTKLGM